MNWILWLAAAVVMAGGVALGQGSATTAPATQAASRPVTAEQRAIIEAANKTATDVPVPRMDTSVYNKDGTPNENFGTPQRRYLEMHESFLKRKEQPIGVLFLGDSITWGWGVNGKKVRAQRYGKLDAANFGIPGDRTETVLWRLEHGELDGVKAKVVVLLIGTNNYRNPADIAKGVKAIVAKIHEKVPAGKVLVLGIFPRGVSAVDASGKPDGGRERLRATNVELAKLDDGKKTRFLEIWKEFLEADGTLTKEVMPDALHPSEKGYVIWADVMQPMLDEMLK